MKQRLTEGQLTYMIREAIKNNYRQHILAESRKFTINETQLRGMILHAINEALMEDDDEYEEVTADDLNVINGAEKGMKKSQLNKVQKDLEDDTKNADTDITSDDNDAYVDDEDSYDLKAIEKAFSQGRVNNNSDRDESDRQDYGIGLHGQDGTPNLPMIILSNFKDEETYDRACELLSDMAKFSKELGKQTDFFGERAISLRPTHGANEPRPFFGPKDFQMSDEMRDNLYNPNEYADIDFVCSDGEKIYVVIAEFDTAERCSQHINAVLGYPLTWSWMAQGGGAESETGEDGIVRYVNPGMFKPRFAEKNGPYKVTKLKVCNPLDYLPEEYVDDFMEVYNDSYNPEDNEEFKRRLEYAKEMATMSNDAKYANNRVVAGRAIPRADGPRKGDY